MEVDIKASWEELTYGEFQQIIQIKDSDIPESYKLSNIVSVVTGLEVDEVENLPITFFKKLTDKLEFLATTPPTIPHKSKYVINGHKYYLSARVDQISTAQYMDYTNYCSMPEGTAGGTDMMSVWLIPEGHKYGDGYDIEEVKRDIEDMPFLDAQAIAFFFAHQLTVFIQILKGCLKKMMKKGKVEKRTIEETLAPLVSMASSLW